MSHPARKWVTLQDLQAYVRELGELPVPDRLPFWGSESVVVVAERWFVSIGATDRYRQRLAELDRVT